MYTLRMRTEIRFKVLAGLNTYRIYEGVCWTECCGQEMVCSRVHPISGLMGSNGFSV